ncbi:hypothetical protein Tco_1209401 [Tanacetum coccineum]
MTYDDIRPIFEKVWDQIQSFVPMGSEIKIKGTDQKDEKKEDDKSATGSRIEKEQVDEKKDVGKLTIERRRKTLARKRTSEKSSDESAKKHKLEDDAGKEELQLYLNIVSEDEPINTESLSTRYPIVDWQTQILGNLNEKDIVVYQIKRADGSTKHYKVFGKMLYDFDRQDMLTLYRLVMEIFQTNNAKGYDLLLWGDLKILVDPKEDGDIWKNQHEWNLLSWKLHNFCGVHMLLMDTGLVIYMMVEKKYPLSKDTISKMLSRRLEIDYQSEMSYELIRFVKSQLQQ